MRQSEIDAKARYLCDALEEIPRHERHNSLRARAIYGEMEKLVALTAANDRPKARPSGAAAGMARRISRQHNRHGLTDEERRFAESVPSHSRFPHASRFNTPALPQSTRTVHQRLVALGARGVVGKLTRFGYGPLAARLNRAAHESLPGEYSSSVMYEIELDVRRAMGEISRRG